MSFKVEKGVPIPSIKQKAKRKKRESKYPFKKMNIGDSFLMKKRVAPNASSAIYTAAKAAGVNIRVRKDEKGNVRVWRIRCRRTSKSQTSS